MTLLLSNEDMAHLLNAESCVAVLEEAYRELGQGMAVNRPKSYVVVPHEAEGDVDVSYSYCTMEGTARSLGVMAIRMKSDVNRFFEAYGTRRAEKWAGRPGLFCGLVMLFSTQTGELLAILNDGLIQQLRVGATSGVAARYLAREDASVLGMIGSGTQARSHARAFMAVRPLKQIKVYSPNPEHRRAYAEEVARVLEVDVVPVESAQAAMQGADIVSPCTSALEPVAEAEWLGPGAHVGGAGGGIRGIFQYADVVVKHHVLDTPHYFAGTDEEAQRAPKAPRSRGERAELENAPTLAEVVLGQMPARTSPTQITYFANNEGNGLQFAACGALAYRRARERGIGRELPTEWFLQDTRD